MQLHALSPQDQWKTQRSLPILARLDGLMAVAAGCHRRLAEAVEAAGRSTGRLLTPFGTVAAAAAVSTSSGSTHSGDDH